MKTLSYLSSIFLLSAYFSFGQPPMVKLKTLAIGDFEFLGAPSIEDEFKPFNQMLIGNLVNSKRFQLVERQKIDRALKEQGLSSTGLVGTNAKEIGMLTGADYIVYGSITDARQESSTQGGKNRFSVTLDLNILDSLTGEIKLADNIETSLYGTPKQIIRKAVEALSREIIFNIYPVTVAANQKGTLILNYGKNYLDEGDVFDIFSQGVAIMDPATGLVLANEEFFLGKILVSSVYPRFSKATILNAEGPIEAGMVCRPAKNVVSSASKQTTPVNSKPTGAIRVAVGEFIYSDELNLSQTGDHSRPVSTHASTKGGGLLGFANKILTGDTNNSSPQPKTQSQTKEAERSDPQGHTKKSDTLREMIVTRLTKTGQFDVLERSRMSEINKEITTITSGAKGFVDQSLLEQVRLKGAEYLLYGTITRLSEDIHNTTKIQQKNTVMLDMTIELRIVDLKSGKIITADEVSSSTESSKKGINLLGLLGTSSEQGGAMGDLMNIASYSIVSKITTSLRPITIIDVNASTRIVMVNYGEGIIDPAYNYSVYSQGKEIRDPYSGQLLGRTEQLIGTIRPIEVANKFSKLEIIAEEGNKNPFMQVGMICRPLKDRDGFRKNTYSREYRSRSEGSNKRRRPVF